MIKSLLPLAIASLFASGHCADVYLDCAFGKDDLRETSILYANKKEGVFAYKMASAVAPGAKGERSHAIAVPGGGTRHLIKGLNPPMNYSGILPLAILETTHSFSTRKTTRFSATDGGLNTVSIPGRSGSAATGSTACSSICCASFREWGQGSRRFWSSCVSGPMGAWPAKGRWRLRKRLVAFPPCLLPGFRTSVRVFATAIFVSTGRRYSKARQTT